ADGEVSGDAAPTADCTSPTAATQRPDGSWTVPLDGLAAGWRSGQSFGLALVPVLSTGVTFHLALDPATTSIVPVALQVAAAAPEAPATVPVSDTAPLARGPVAPTTAAPLVRAPTVVDQPA